MPLEFSCSRSFRLDLGTAAQKMAGIGADPLAAVVILLLMTFVLSRSGTAENAYELYTPLRVGVLAGGLGTGGGLLSLLASRRPQFWTRTFVITGIGFSICSNLLWLRITAR